MVSLSHGLGLLNTFLLAIGVNLLARDATGVVAAVGYVVTGPLILVGGLVALVWVTLTLGDVLERRYGT